MDGGGRASFAERLAALRDQAGLSLAEVATAAHVARGYVHHIEHGRRWPTQAVAQALDSALDAGGVLLAAWEVVDALPRAAAAPADPEDRERVALAARHPRRVDAATVSAPVQPWELADILTQATISATTLDHMERAMFSYATRYPSTPPALLLPAVSAPLPRLRDALNRPQPLQTRRRAVMLLGVLSGLAGNLWLDLGREDQATGFFDIGELAGHEAEDPDLMAWVLATRSIGPFFAGQHRDAADLLARAEDAAALRSSPRRRAWVAALRARAAAAVGDHHLSRAALERAHQHMAAVSEPPSGTEFFDAPRLDGVAGTTYLLMTDTHRAVPLLTQARDRRAPTDAKGRALVTLDLAECHAVDHEPEEAARLATYALDGVDGSMVAPIVTRARSLFARVDRWSELPAVRELDARMAELPRG